MTLNTWCLSGEPTTPSSCGGFGPQEGPRPGWTWVRHPFIIFNVAMHHFLHLVVGIFTDVMVEWLLHSDYSIFILTGVVT